MPSFDSPLRYPGGKAKMASFISQIIALNRMKGCVYAEPYAGGAGVALALLYSERVSRILINDFDARISAFWHTIVNHSTPFLDLLEDTHVDIDEWHKQREIYRHPEGHSEIQIGFAAFFLNRCNRSGIIVNGGPIGGFNQAGKWKIDARYNRNELGKRIERVSLYKERIGVFNLDSLEFLRKEVYPLSERQKVFAYLDPPYYDKGPALYLNAYKDEDHRRLASYIKRIKRFKWLLTYDNKPEIKHYYQGLTQTPFTLSYTAYKRQKGNEILIHPKGVITPKDAEKWISGVTAA